MSEQAFGWNVDQIMVYIWQCLAGDQSEREYPYSKFANSEAGKRLKLELVAAAQLRGLVARWRMFARGSGATPWADGINRCADELERFLEQA